MYTETISVLCVTASLLLLYSFGIRRFNVMVTKFFFHSVLSRNSFKISETLSNTFCRAVSDSGLVIERCEKITDTCNVTGKWLEYSHGLESKCMSYTSVYQQYKNAHCFMCSEHRISDITDVCNGTMFDSSISPSFMALLDFRYHEETNYGRQMYTLNVPTVNDLTLIL